MKYKLLKDLPFLQAGNVFGTGCWAGGGFGVDRGTTHYEGGGSSHNGVRVFEKHENQLLKDILEDEDWIEKIPEYEGDLIEKYKYSLAGISDPAEIAIRLNYFIEEFQKYLKNKRRNEDGKRIKNQSRVSLRGMESPGVGRDD